MTVVVEGLHDAVLVGDVMNKAVEGSEVLSGGAGRSGSCKRRVTQHLLIPLR